MLSKECSALRSSVGVDDVVLKDIRHVGHLLTDRVPEMLEHFYGWLTQLPEFSIFFRDPTLVTRVKSQQAAYWCDFLRAEVDDQYVERRRIVGYVHARIELGLLVYLRAMEFVSQWLIGQVTAIDRSLAGTTVAFSIRKLIQFDSAIVVHTYAARTAQLLEDQRTHLEHVASVMRAVTAGELQRRVEVTGPGDLLGPSVNAMVSSLASIAREMGLIARGDYSGDVAPMSANDELGVSLQAMTRALREAADLNASQQEELHQVNDTLAEQARVLEAQKDSLLAAETVLRQKATELERASRYKSEFLANMSHELRTPLNSTLILAKLLVDNRDKNLTDEQVKYGQSIQEAGNDLLALINDILDLSRIEVGKMDLHITPVTVTRLANDLRMRFEPIAADKHVRLSIMVDPRCPESIETDSQRVRQILTNLLSNAVKFTEQGSIRVLIAPRDEQHLAFIVEDTGIGIPIEKHEVVFEAFRQADGTTNRRFGGTGLGLSISRELATLLGGVIELRSTPGEGSSFSVILPIRSDAISTTADFPIQTTSRRVPSTTKVSMSSADDRRDPLLEDRHVLLVEDDVRNLFALTSMLESRRLVVTVARNGSEALEQLGKVRDIDLVLMDIMMPKMDGIQAMQMIRMDDRWTKLPIIALTAKAMVDDRQQCLLAGANDYIAKPINVEALLSLLRRWLPITN